MVDASGLPDLGSARNTAELDAEEVVGKAVHFPKKLVYTRPAAHALGRWMGHEYLDQQRSAQAAVRHLL